MTTPADYLRDLQQTEFAEGQRQLRTLMAKYHATLERLPRFKGEVQAHLSLATQVDFTSLTTDLQNALEKATTFLTDLDLVPLLYPAQTDLPPFGNGLAAVMTAQNVAALAARFNKQCLDSQVEADNFAAEARKQEAVKTEAEKRRQEAQAIARQREAAATLAEQNRLAEIVRLGYVEHGDGTVTDTKTKLMWKQSAEGQTGTNCGGNGATFTWDVGLKIPVTLNLRGGFAGYHDWRLPSKEELESLIFAGRNPAICTEAFPNCPQQAFWSSSPDGDDGAWGVSFGDGSVGSLSRSGSYAVRLVRASQ